jgi:hypothetical protein
MCVTCGVGSTLFLTAPLCSVANEADTPVSFASAVRLFISVRITLFYLFICILFNDAVC